MRYPTANLGALGRATLFPAAVAGRPPPPRLGRRILGITASSAPAAEELRKAQDMMGRVQATYPKLVATIGEASAREAFDQAVAGLERARQDYQDALGADGGMSG